MLKYRDKNRTRRGKREKSRKVERTSVMASVGLFFEGPSILAKTAMAAVNPVSGGPSTIFSSPGQCWHFNYCWVNSFAPMKAARPNRICRLPDLWTRVTQDTIGARPKLSLPSPYYSLLLQLLIPRWVRLWKNTREGEKKRKKTQLQHTTIKYIFVSQTSSDWSERDSQWYYSCKRSMPLSRLMCLHLPSTPGPSKAKTPHNPSEPPLPHATHPGPQLLCPKNTSTPRDH